MKSITSPGLMHETGCLEAEHWDDPEGWDGEGDGRTADQNCPHWPDRIVTTCMSYLTTGGPGKECGTNKLLASGGIQERSKGSHRPPRILVGIHLVCAHHQEGP